MLDLHRSHPTLRRFKMRGLFHGQLRLATLMLAMGMLAACGPSIVPLDTRPRDSSQAEDLAYSVASKAGCGDFESLDPQGTEGIWHFACRIGAYSYDIVVFGSDELRESGLKSLKDSGRPYVAKDYYAVTVAPSGPSKSEALAASEPPSALDPFK
jgi:hypothetical protein